MRVYKCVVNCGGSVLNQVVMPEATAAEIILLQSIHGEASVQDIVPLRMDKRPHAQERDRLGAIYGDDRVSKVFGPSFHPLPVKLADDTARIRANAKLDPKPVPVPGSDTMFGGQNDEDGDSDEGDGGEDE